VAVRFLLHVRFGLEREGKAQPLFLLLFSSSLIAAHRRAAAARKKISVCYSISILAFKKILIFAAI
jgi:hypothetical protein